MVALLTMGEAKEKFKLVMAEWQIQQEELIQKAFHFAQAEYIVSYEHLTNYLLSSKQPFVLTYVSKIAVIAIGNQYLVKSISSYSEQEDLQQFEQQLRELIERREWHLCANCTSLYRFYIAFVQRIYSKKKAYQIITDVTKKIIKTNKKSLPIKQMHLLYIVYLFSIQSNYVQREIKAFDRRWSSGKWALNKKEQVLLHYIKMHLAARLKRWKKVRLHAELLLKEDLLASYTVELTIDYGMLLPSYNTDPTIFIKSFKHHYVEYTTYLCVMALEQLKDNEGIIRLMKTEPIVSCTMLYTYFQTANPDELVRVETVVQQNIGLLVDGHHRNVRASIQKWQQLREQGWIANDLITTLSEHICRLLKACFVTEELTVFEKLMTIYVKYFYVEPHFISLKASLQSNIDYTDLAHVK